jgi:hypothetical protein
MFVLFSIYLISFRLALVSCSIFNFRPAHAISTTAQTHSHPLRLNSSLHNQIFQPYKPKHVDLVVQKLSDAYIWAAQLTCRSSSGLRRSYIRRAFFMHKYHRFPVTRELNIPPILASTLIGLILLRALWVAFPGPLHAYRVL